MALAHFMMLNNEFLNKDPYVFTEQATLIKLDKKSAIIMAKDVKDTKHTKQISRGMYLERNGED